MKSNKNKRGELTTQQLVVIIILIVSFIVILFLLFRLNLGETSTKEICHNSVVLKAKSGILAGPLDCRTNYLCISGGGDCGEISATATVKVNPKNKDEIMKAIADEMSDCWWMFGEGKIDYVKEDLSKRVVCALCSVIEFENIDVEPISYKEFFNYLKTTPKSNSQTYLQYLYATNTFDEEDPYYQNEFDFTKQYSLVTGMAKKGYLLKAAEWPYYLAKSLFTDEEEESEEGIFAVIVEKREDIGNLDCTEFITKS